VLQIARELLGKVLVTQQNGRLTSGMIVECEAYTGENDKAAHVYGGKRTRRTEQMYGDAGHAYIYFCYGIHHLINVVTHTPGVPHAVLLRALEPLEGIDIMMERRKKAKLDHTLTRGPGSLCQALGIHTNQNGVSLTGNDIWIEDRGLVINPSAIASGPRIGVDYAGEDALLPYRFWLKDNPYVSKVPAKKKHTKTTKKPHLK
jgi:DNA-3-methyladenine glycosylase